MGRDTRLAPRAPAVKQSAGEHPRPDPATGAPTSRLAPGRDEDAFHEPVRRLLELLAGQGGQRCIVGLVGLPGAGKSTLARRLAQQVDRHLGEGSAQVLGMDGFHLTRAQLAQCPDPQAALARRGAPWTFDPQALAQRLRAIRALPQPTCAGTEEVRWPGFEHGVGDPVPDAIAVPARARLLLLEGLYLLHRVHGWNLDGLLDVCWYLDVALEPALERLTHRHMASWGMDRAQAWARVQRNDRLNAQIVAATRPRAHWLVPAACAGL